MVVGAATKLGAGCLAHALVHALTILALGYESGLVAKADPPEPGPLRTARVSRTPLFAGDSERQRTAPAPAAVPGAGRPLRPPRRAGECRRCPLGEFRPVRQSTAPADRLRDAPVRRVQAAPGDLSMPALPGAPPASPRVSARRPDGSPRVGGQSISLQAALYGAITSNPDLVALRNSNVASPEAVEVARRFPTTLNPTLWIDFRPINLIPPDTFGGTGGGTPQHRTGPFYHFGKHDLLHLRPPADRAGAPDDPPLPHRPGRAATSSSGPWSRPSCSRWSRPTASSRRPPTAARSSGWPSELADFNDRLAADPRAAGSRPTRSRRPTSCWPRSRTRRPASWSRSPGRTTPTP